MLLSALVPASSANLGPGFDCFGLALDLVNEVTFDSEAEPGVSWEGEGAHALPTDEYPLVIRRYGSDEGIAGTGVSLYYALPFSGSAGTWEITAQGTTADNEVLYAGGNRASVNAKLQAFWQLSRATYLMASVSGAYGTNPDTSLKTTLGAVAARFTWRPPAQRWQAQA